jgi:hypothetical protein
MTDLDPAVVGSCSIATLINRAASVVWRCLARFDGNPLFHTLRSEQAYSGSTE